MCRYAPVSAEWLGGKGSTAKDAYAASLQALELQQAVYEERLMLARGAAVQSMQLADEEERVHALLQEHVPDKVDSTDPTTPISKVSQLKTSRRSFSRLTSPLGKDDDVEVGHIPAEVQKQKPSRDAKAFVKPQTPCTEDNDADLNKPIGRHDTNLSGLLFETQEKVSIALFHLLETISICRSDSVSGMTIFRSTTVAAHGRCGSARHRHGQGSCRGTRRAGSPADCYSGQPQ